MRILALPPEVEHWSLSTLREQLVKIGATVVRHGRYVTFQLAEVAIPLPLFAEIAATDRRPATKARADMKPCVIAAAGLNRRVLGSRCLANDRFLAPDCVSARSRTHRAPHPKTPNRVVG